MSIPKIALLIQQDNIIKGKWLTPDINIRADQMIWLVKNAYKRTSKGSFVNSAGDLAHSDWTVIDFDEDPQLDAEIFYRTPRSGQTWSGYKIQGLGHDGSPEAINKVISKLKQLLSTSGYWIEASEKLQSLLYRLSVPYIHDEAIARQIFPNKNLKFIGTKGQYTRLQSGQYLTQTIFGHPIVK